jgi:hypothetical protein
MAKTIKQKKRFIGLVPLHHNYEYYTYILSNKSSGLPGFARKIPKNRLTGGFYPTNYHRTNGSRMPVNRDFCGTLHRKNPQMR